MIEVEVKYKIDDIEKVEKVVKELGKFIIEKIEEDFYFNSPIRDFRLSDEALRVRVDKEGTTLTYKGKKLDKKTKTREEINIKVDNFENTIKLLRKLGFELVRKVKKLRKIYDIGGIIVCLDNVENLGNFIELEIDVNNAEEIANAKSELFEIANKIGIKSKIITKSYLEMLEEI